MLKHTDLYTTNGGFQIKMATSQLDNSIAKLLAKVDKDISNFSAKQLLLTKQSANLMAMDKNLVTDDETVHDIFSELNSAQILHFLKYFKPDELSPDPVPKSVIQQVEETVAKQKKLNLNVDPAQVAKLNVFAELE
eukprot:TRINITY_DN4954_c0_g1_i4.p1 TRINITY_DN4954_c0_g1~~TRINITY_DN4954_c0_g1_i4.p1  ORF type:complete len:136 (-),score=49.93 TRINITY_DN4954_c0_g1_i4:8-415(-)